MIDLRGFISAAADIVQRGRLDQPGAYARLASIKGAALGPVDPYGCSDAANVLYTIGSFPRDLAERAGFVAAMHALQEPGSGLYRENTHHPIHTTAHCLAALELFDAGPAHPLTALATQATPDGIRTFLDQLDWQSMPWQASHQGAGVYAALMLAGEGSPAFEDAYFGWVMAETDPATGLARKGFLEPVEHSGAATLFPHLAGTFHYLFNFQAARRPWAQPAALIDTCLALRAENRFPLGRTVGFAEIDWVYCLGRSMRRTDHRFAEGMAALEGFAHDYAGFLLGLDPLTHERLNDLHMLFGVLCALAELQQTLPGLLQTERPLKLVLDRRPFI
jgi:hypothetical protein